MADEPLVSLRHHPVF